MVLGREKPKAFSPGAGIWRAGDWQLVNEQSFLRGRVATLETQAAAAQVTLDSMSTRLLALEKIGPSLFDWGAKWVGTVARS